MDPWTGWSEWWPLEDWYDLMAYDTQWERDQKIQDEYNSIGLSNMEAQMVRKVSNKYI